MNASTQTDLRILLDKIDHNPYQPRHGEDPAVTAEIAASIERNGLMQVPTARVVGDRFQLAFGHTRLAAYQLLASQGKADYEQMPLIVRELSDLQMFELGVAENIKRRDLNPIETASAMRTYLDTFHKTSEEAAEFFNVSAETVRGKIRLLGLPAEVQTKIQNKELSEADGRKLLTVQRVAPKEAAVIGKQAGAAMSRTLDEAVQDAIRGNKAVVQMWGTWHDDDEGKARGGDGLWPLDWKHTGLHPFEPSEIREILGITSGKLTEPVAAQIHTLWEALAAGMTVSAEHFALLPVDGVQALIHLANPPACTVCPMHMVLDGSHYCGDHRCWERKKAAWLDKDLRALSRKLDLARYNPITDIKPVDVYESTYGDYAATFRKRVTKKDTDLRLMIKKHNYGNWPATDHPWIAVVDLSMAHAKQIQQKREAHKTERSRSDWDSPENVARRRYAELLQDRSRKFTDMAIPVFSTVFKDLKNIAAMECLAGRGRTKADWPKPKKLQHLHEVLAAQALRNATSWDHDRQGPVAMAKHLRNLAKTWGISLPQDWDKRAQALMPEKEKPVVVETKKAKKK